MTIVTSQWPPYPLRIKAGQNLEPAYSDLVAVHAGNLATLYGHIVGGETVGGSPNGAPRNPSGDYGHDHSGGHYGRALFRSVATVTCDHGETDNGATLVGGGGAASQALAAAADSTTTLSDVHEIPFWVPPCDPKDGAYINLGLYGRIHLQTSALLAGDTLTVLAWNLWEDAEPAKTSFSISAPNTTGTKEISSGASTTIRVKPGAVNLFHLQAKVVRTTGGSSRGALLRAREIELGVYSV